MTEIRWNPEKSERLRKVRGISFERILEGKLIAVKRHPTEEGQSLMLFEYKGYVWVVPFVTQGDDIFLKTLYPSRKYTRRYRKGEAL